MPVKLTFKDLDGVPVKVWTTDLDENSSAQLLKTSRLPCMFHHVAAMPDAHLGIGSTVGSVIATKGAIIPAAVGVDIGCGMMAIKTPFTASQLPDNLKGLRSDIEWGVPVGFDQHNAPLAEVDEHDLLAHFEDLHPAVQTLRQKAMCQLGTLGGGNHFIEICLDTEDDVWVMLHSGSRHIGNKLAVTHIEVAKGLFGESLKALDDPNLASLAEDTPEFLSYWHDLQWAQSYAWRNRELMMKKVLQAVAKHILGDWKAEFPHNMRVHCHHNYAEREMHYGEKVFITRKGAVRAQVDDYGIIPGNMGARSFIVVGKGEPESFNSCSHGAGRRMSRTQAKKSFTVDDVVAQTMGIECKKDRSVLDEIPSAYKPIDEVMANQSDLVSIIAELHQVICVKG